MQSVLGGLLGLLERYAFLGYFQRLVKSLAQNYSSKVIEQN